MSYASALARISELQAHVGALGGTMPTGNVSFAYTLQTAQNRFQQGPDLLDTPAGGANNGTMIGNPGGVLGPGGIVAGAAMGPTSAGTGAGRVPANLNAIFNEMAAKYDVPPALAKAIGRAESGFRVDAGSPAGAQGIMQLMPATASGLGVTNILDPRQNIEGGVKYIAAQLKRFNGDVELALAAYNAGPGAVQRYGGIPPYEETQNYVRRVKEYAREYGLEI